MYASVIVPLDGSTFGEHALPLALNIARRNKIALEVVHIDVPLAELYAEPRPNIESPSNRLIKRQAKKYLEEVGTHLRSLTQFRVNTTILEGPIAETLRSFVADRPESLVVMTTHGRGPLSRFWLGSVVDAFVRGAPSPVLLVHPAGEKPALGAAPTMPHILIPLDGSLLSEEILEPAVKLGKVMDSALTLLRVVEPLYFVGQGAIGDLPAVYDPGWTKEEEETARNYLEKVADRLRTCGLRVSTRVHINASVPMAVLEEARAENMSCIALSTHGRRGLARAALGSVADKIVRAGTLPTLILKPTKL
jgi:nucleotide-binding universal stress UspA family protein